MVLLFNTHPFYYKFIIKYKLKRTKNKKKENKHSYLSTSGMFVIILKQQCYKRTLFKETRQYNTQIFYKYIFFKYRTRQIKATETNK